MTDTPILITTGLRARVTEEDIEILKGVDLEIRPGEIHAIMGPNGSGKSTFAKVLAGHPGYEVTGGSAFFDGQDLLELETDERSRAGLFMAFQYPVAIPGVSIANFLRTALQARMGKGDDLDLFDFQDLLLERMEMLEMSPSFAERAVNDGFSGGEEEAQRNPSDGSAGPVPRRHGRDRFGPRHRRAQGRCARRKHPPEGAPGDGGAADHALPAGCSTTSSRTSFTSSWTGASSVPAAPKWRFVWKRAATASTRSCSPPSPPHDRGERLTQEVYHAHQRSCSGYRARRLQIPFHHRGRTRLPQRTRPEREGPCARSPRRRANRNGCSISASRRSPSTTPSRCPHGAAISPSWNRF